MADGSAQRPGPRVDGPAVGSDPRETGDVLASLTANVQALVRTEVELAKLEVSSIVREKLIAAGALVAAGIVGLFLFGFIGVTAAVALRLVVPAWLAWLIVTLVYALLVAIAGLVGMRFMKRPAMPQRTKDEAVGTVAWAKGQVKP